MGERGATTVATDGRTARSVRTRSAIVDAHLALLREGNLTPTTHQIAARAQVTQRTLFNHFKDVPALFAAVAARQVRHIEGRLLSAPVEGTRDQRVQRYLHNLSALLDDIAPVRWAALSAASPTAAVRRAIDYVHGLVIEGLQQSLGADGPKVTERGQLRRLLELAMDPVAWRLMRLHQGLTRKQACDQMVRNVLALLDSETGS